MPESIKIASVGNALVLLREKSGISPSDLAKRLGWDRSRLHKYENNDLALSVPVIEEIAVALGERPEAVVLYCLKQRYPELDSSEVGKLLDTLVNEMSGAHTQT